MLKIPTYIQNLIPRKQNTTFFLTFYARYSTLTHQYVLSDRGPVCDLLVFWLQTAIELFAFSSQCFDVFHYNDVS